MLIAIRAIHFIAIAQLAGALAFGLLIAPARTGNGGLCAVFNQRLRTLVRASAVLALLSWLVWLLPVSAEMAGLSMSALAGEVVRRVIVSTEFGHVWLWRVALLMLLVALLAPSTTPLLQSRRRLALALFIAGVAVASLALSGHAAAQTGSTKLVALVSDATHLLAASGWLGALLPLSLALLTTRDNATACVLARRFSWLGITCVAAIVASGVWNSSYLVGSWGALFGTEYGDWLLLKLVLVACMLILAVINRQTTPTLGSGDPDAVPARRRIARNATSEAVLGAGVLGVVAVLGVSVPAAHDQPQWPFSFRLDFDAAWPTVVRAYPTTYAHPAVPYTAAAIAQGLALYERNCASCHGAQGHGDGPDAVRLSIPAADLTGSHVLAHTPGDLYWWISEGIKRSAMPGFAAVINERERWELVHLVRTIAAAHSLDHTPVTWPVRAPAFAYQMSGGLQASVPSPNRTMSTLVVFFTPPISDSRLSELAQAMPQLHREGVDVVAMRLDGSSNKASLDSPLIGVVTASPDVSTAYGLLAHLRAGDEPHVEFLVDRKGWVRGRWHAHGVIAVGDLERLIGSLPTVPTSDGMPTHQHHD